jgi:hypothetical protein
MFNLKGWLAIACVGLSALANTQSFNIDLDVSGGPPEAGHGVPATSFGAAASQQGFWNAVGVTAAGPEQLRDLAGELTGVTVTVTGFGSGGGSNLPINTGNYALLLNDYARISDRITYGFAGLAAGRYQIYCYAVDATGANRPVDVSVPGSITPNPQLVSGVMPGNSFVLGVTHSVHELQLAGNSFTLLARNHIQGPPNGSVNGFQIVAVPEPATVCFLGTACLTFVCRRRRNR